MGKECFEVFVQDEGKAGDLLARTRTALLGFVKHGRRKINFFGELSGDVFLSILEG